MSGRWSSGDPEATIARGTEYRRTRERRGRRAELLAAAWLWFKGYRIVERRAKTPLGEIDLVACKGRLLVFVEVKARPTVGAALEAVTPVQRRRVEEAARLWVGRRSRLSGLSWRFDVVAMAPNALPKHLRDAWRPEIALTGSQSWRRT